MLAGQPASYLVQEMQNYVPGARKDSSKGSAMLGFLRELSDEDFQNIAAYFEAQKRY